MKVPNKLWVNVISLAIGFMHSMCKTRLCNIATLSYFMQPKGLCLLAFASETSHRLNSLVASYLQGCDATSKTSRRLVSLVNKT